MKNIYLSFLVGIMLHLAFDADASIALTPTISPPIFSPNTEITLTYDVTNITSFDTVSNAYLWCWIPTDDGAINATTNVNPASEYTSTSAVKFTKSTVNQTTTFSLTFTPSDLFDEDISSADEIGFIIKRDDWDVQSSDYIATFHQGDFSALLQSPANTTTFVDNGQDIAIQAYASDDASFTLYVNDVLINQQSTTTSFSYTHTATENEGQVNCDLLIEDNASANDTTISFSYIIRSDSKFSSRPEGIISGINYDASDNTIATLCLYTPGKNTVYVLGEFNNFNIDSDYQMYQDGDYFWLEISNLDPKTEYAFQYLVDETIYIADPYSDKILDTDDADIPDAIYPNLKEYPSKALYSDDYKNRLAVIQTDQDAYTWQNTDYNRPEKENLIIYELHIRDFFEENDRNYSNLTDTLSYFENLGINAIELMPIQEFQNNNSWGYNPTFMFAPDKAYGTKTALKEFIDAAHAKGIAVILDVVFNHQDLPNPYLAMWFDYDTYEPTEDNPMFNVEATHPYSVFYDMNHESTMTQHYMDTTLNYWINQYEIDGFRFDLSKGFTQTYSGDDVSKWGEYDQSRIDIIERMADQVWSYSPNTWLILEHFADNSEEIELSSHGLMLWGNMNENFKEAILGYNDDGNSDLSWSYAKDREWDNLNLVTYMESHDEERQMYEAEENGKNTGTYNIQQPSTALQRVKAAAAILFNIPGPKMLWQFGELGYDYSINYPCLTDDCRTDEKPVEWDYYNESERKKLYDVISEIIDLRMQLDINNADFDWEVTSANKWISIDGTEMDAVVAANFEATESSVSPGFPVSGIWYDLFSGEEVEIESTSPTLEYEPGEFHIYTSEKVDDVKEDLVPWSTNTITAINTDQDNDEISVYPNPTTDIIRIKNNMTAQTAMEIIDINGQTLIIKEVLPNNSIEIDMSAFPEGLYTVRIFNENEQYARKFLKR